MTVPSRRVVPAFLGLIVALSAWGLVPVTASAGPQRQSHPSIYIDGDEQFNPAHGVRKGTGTKENPFVISGWTVRSIYIKDTSKHFVIRNNTIENLTLNWNGDAVTIVDNEIGDLRVNQNIPRTGGPTSGLIARNTIGLVGQLRHFDGVFKENVVGNQDAMTLPFFSNRAVNFDGFHGAKFHHNTIYGYVDVRLHGHHHGSNFNSKSHYHGTPSAEEGTGGHMGDQEVDHTQRYHQVQVYNNRIHSPGPWALRYFDQAHSANDRTAASEDNPALNLPHKHFTRVYLRNNKLYGSGLRVDVFNADDELHQKIGHGSVVLADNKIVLEHNSMNPWSRQDGIVVQQAQGIMLHIAGNSVSWKENNDLLEQDFYDVAGIRLNDMDTGKIHIYNNSVSDVD
ncbi:MAG: hypothetical protein M3285_05315, partial [Actinomycetota bacterium]|nr:hypothetical protein [Actinomycetota bacterium]